LFARENNGVVLRVLFTIFAQPLVQLLVAERGLTTDKLNLRFIPFFCHFNSTPVFEVDGDGELAYKVAIATTVLFKNAGPVRTGQHQALGSRRKPFVFIAVDQRFV
jgi:hypothetical protein